MSRSATRWHYSLPVAGYFLLILWSIPSFAGITIHVPAEQPTIRAAIRAAIDGDIILVADGIYRGQDNKNLQFGGKALTLRSENGPRNCILDLEGSGRAYLAPLWRLAGGCDLRLHHY